MPTKLLVVTLLGKEVVMWDQQKLDEIQRSVLRKITDSASKADLQGVRVWGEAASEFERLSAEAKDIEARLKRFEMALSAEHVNGVRAEASRPRMPRTFGRAGGAAARNAWTNHLNAKGIFLRGNGTRYSTESNKSVGVAFANELPEFPNKWWLGLPDTRWDIIALLCNDSTGRLIDIVISDLRPSQWDALSRSAGQVKFNVRRDAKVFTLLLPGREPLVVTSRIGDYSSLR